MGGSPSRRRGNTPKGYQKGTKKSTKTISTIPESPDPDGNALTVAGTYTVAAGHTTAALDVGTIINRIERSAISFQARQSRKIQIGVVLPSLIK